MPEGAVYIGNAAPWRPYELGKSKWGNPFKEGKDGTRTEVIARYEAWLHTQPELMEALPELRGWNLVCWCAPNACHGDVLIRLANRVAAICP